MILLAIALGAGALLLAAWLWTLRRAPLLFRPDEGSSPFTERVSVIIPMYNEERNVDEVLAGVRTQTHANLEVIAINDRSSDGTATKLAEWQRRWPELRVVTLDHHPADWTGKTWPMYHGARAATGDWLLFLDADLKLAPGSVAATAGACSRRGWDALGILGRLRFGTWLEKVVHVNLATYYLILVAESQQAMMCGHYMLVRRSVYQAVGGWAMVYDEMQDDVALPRLLSEHGYVPRMRVWLDSHEVGEYPDLPQLWRAMRRVIAGGAGFSPLPSAVPAIGGLVVHFGPWFVLLWGVLHRWWMQPLPAAVLGLAAAMIAFAAASYGKLARMLGVSAWCCLIRPLSDLLAAAIQIDASLRAAFGSLDWKGQAFGRRRGFSERPEEINSVASFFVAAREGGATRAWVERMTLESAQLRFMFDALDRWSLGAHLFVRLQPGTTFAHIVNVSLQHRAEVRQRLKEIGLEPRGGRFLFLVAYGFWLSQLGVWFPGWLHWLGKRYGVDYGRASAEGQRAIRGEAFKRLEQQHRPWFQATPWERKPGEVEAEAVPASGAAQ